MRTNMEIVYTEGTHSTSEIQWWSASSIHKVLSQNQKLEKN